jgi:hypothetical protein
MKTKLIIITALAIIGVMYIFGSGNCCLDRESALMAKDSSNLRQIVRAVNLYKSDCGIWPTGKNDIQAKYPGEFPDGLFKLRDSKCDVPVEKMIVYLVVDKVYGSKVHPVLLTGNGVVYKEKYGLMVMSDETIRVTK